MDRLSIDDPPSKRLKHRTVVDQVDSGDIISIGSKHVVRVIPVPVRVSPNEKREIGVSLAQEVTVCIGILHIKQDGLEMIPCPQQCSGGRLTSVDIPPPGGYKGDPNPKRRSEVDYPIDQLEVADIGSRDILLSIHRLKWPFSISIGII